MATIESDKADAALAGKMGCEVDRSKRDHNFFFVKENGMVLSSTKISKGSKHTLGEDLVSVMGKKLGLGGGGNFVKFVSCKIDRDAAIKLIQSNSQ
jgi:hypothetical protein